MRVGLIIPVSLQASNVVDPTPSLEELMLSGDAPIFNKDLLIKDTDWIYSYQGETFTPRIYSTAVATVGGYDVDEILVRDGKLIKVTGKDQANFKEVRRAKEPEEYGSYDTDMNYSAWSHRYFRVSASKKAGWLNKMWKSPSGRRWYYMFWEARGYGGCGHGAWRWSAKDLDANIGQRNIMWYLRTCLAKNTSTKFDAAKDIKAAIPYWGSSQSSSHRKEGTIQFKSMIERGGYFYFRTHLNKRVEYTPYTTTGSYEYSYMTVLSPSDIDGFEQREHTIESRPFDHKEYTKADIDTTAIGNYASWTFVATAPFDNITIAGVICDSIDVVIRDENGNIKEGGQLNNYKVDNTVNTNSDREYYATVPLYTSDGDNPETAKLWSSESVITVILHGGHVAVGEIVVSETLKAGKTKHAFKIKPKDFSFMEEDKWGNYMYKEGSKVRDYSGSAEFEIMSLDQMARLQMLITGQSLVINGSDSIKNEVPDGEHIFEATMMIGRFLSFEISSKEKNKRIGDKGVYNYSVRQLV